MNAIETSDISFSYTKRPFIDNLTIRVPENSIYGFLGPNGAGKTTVIKLLTGLLKPGNGRISYWNEDFISAPLAIKSKLGCMIETPSLYNHLTVKENLLYLDKIYKKGAGHITKILELVDLKKAENLKTKKLSLGMRQRLGLAMALYNEPKLLIVDEPTNALDPSGIVEVRNLLRKLQQEDGLTVFISSHVLGEVEKLCSHLGIINEGKLVFQGKIDEAIALGTKKAILTTDNQELAYSILNKHPLDIKQINGNLELFVRGPSELNKAIQILVKENVFIADITTGTTSLEELFLRLTKK